MLWLTTQNDRIGFVLEISSFSQLKTRIFDQIQIYPKFDQPEPLKRHPWIKACN